MKKIFFIFFLLPMFVHAQTISITASSDSICSGNNVTFTAAISGTSSPHYSWQINGTNTGFNTPTFSTSSLSNGDTVTCLLTNAAGDTIVATSNQIGMTVQFIPVTGMITGPSKVCVNATITLSDSIAGGIWTASNDHATVSGGIVTGISAIRMLDFRYDPAYDTIYYIVSNLCGSDTSSKIITINPLANADFAITAGFNERYAPSNFVCTGKRLSVSFDNYCCGTLYSTNGNVNVNPTGIYGIAAGTDYVKNVVNNSCGTDTVTQMVTVGGMPVNPPFIIAPKAICVNDTIILSDTNQYYTHEWKSVYGKIKINSNSGKAVGITPGIDTITLTNYTSCGKSAVFKIDIEVLPPGPILPTSKCCKGNSIQIKNSSTGGIWGIDNSNIASIDQNGILKCNDTGNVTVFYTLNSCTTDTLITILEKPDNIAGNNILCMGSTIAYTSATTGGKWSCSDSTIAYIDSMGLSSGLDLGNAVITYTSTIGCFDTKPITVAPLPLPITGDSSIFAGNATTVHSNSPNGIWSSNDEIIASIEPGSGIIHGNQTGFATINYTLPTGCKDTMRIEVFYDKNEMAVYPNPSNTDVIIYAYLNIYKNYTIVNDLGELIQKGDLSNAFTKIDVRSLIKGQYYITLYGTGKQQYVSKFLKD